MKVCYLTRSLKVQRGGLDRYSFEVISRMTRRPEVEVTVLVEDSSGQPYEQAILKSQAFAFRPLFFNVVNARRYIKNSNIVHALDLYPYGLIAALANIGLGKRLFINGVGTESVVKLSHPLLRPVLKWVYRRAEKVFCISDYTRQRILQKAPDLSNLEVVYLGVDYEKFQSPHPAFPLRPRSEMSSHPLPQAGEGRGVRGPVLIGVGALKRRKGYHISIPAVAKIIHKYPSLKYYIVGGQEISGFYRFLNELVEKNKLQNNVKFLADISEEELIQLYHQADLFILTSINIGEHFEGFGLVFLEAAAAGLPGIGTANCGIAEAVKEGVTGVLVPQEDVEATARAIDKLLSDRQLRTRLGKQAKKFASSMDWRNTVGAYLKYYLHGF